VVFDSPGERDILVMNRPRRTGTRRGRSREATPTREVEDRVQEPPQEDTNENPLPRRSTRNRRGSPTPPPTSNDIPSVADETDRTSDGGDSHAQHADEENEVTKTSYKEGSADKDGLETFPEESKGSDQAEQVNDEPRKPHATPSHIAEVKRKDEAPNQTSTTPKAGTDENGESSFKEEIPTVSQENDTVKKDVVDGRPVQADSLPKLNDAKPKSPDTGSKTATGPGDDHAMDEKDDSRDKECSKALAGEQPVSESNGAGDQVSDNVASTSLRGGVNVDKSTVVGGTSIPYTDNDTGRPVSVGNRTETESGPRVIEGTSRSESRTVSVGSKSAVEAVDDGGNDHEEPGKIPASPQLSVDSLDKSQDQPNDHSDQRCELKVNELLPQSDAANKMRKLATPFTRDEKSAEKGRLKNISVSDEKSPAGSNAPCSASAPQQGEIGSASHVASFHNALHTGEQKMSSGSLRQTPNDLGKPRASISNSQEAEKRTDEVSVECAAESDANPTETTNLTTALVVSQRSTVATHDNVRDKDSADTEGSNEARTPGSPMDGESHFESTRSSLLGRSHLSAPRLERTVSNPAVVSNAFAIDIRPTAKSSSKIRRFSGSSSSAPPRADLAATRQNTPDIASVNNSQQESRAHVKSNASLESRKHRLADDGDISGESSSCESRPEKRQRSASPVAVSSSTIQNAKLRHRSRRGTRILSRGRVSSRRASRAIQPGLSQVESVKIRLYDIASTVHHGKGPERRFAVYWEALSHFVSSQAASSGNRSSLVGVHEVLDAFLITKQMRKLHNLLIMGKLGREQQCMLNKLLTIFRCRFSM